jgi:hypothetical protein
VSYYGKNTHAWMIINVPTQMERKEKISNVAGKMQI